MSEAETIARLEREVVEAHQQVLERDQRVHDLTRQNVELRAYVDAILKTKAWKAAEAFRRTRNVILRRST
jgi:hypothetical protein